MRPRPGAISHRPSNRREGEPNKVGADSRQRRWDRNQVVRRSASPQSRLLRRTSGGAALVRGGSPPRNKGPVSIFPAARQSASARTGQVTGSSPRGMPTALPSPSWSVLLLRIPMIKPSRLSSRSSTWNPTSSEWRNAPANPSSSSARSRFPSSGIRNLRQNLF